jgi:hypothetical protein
MLYAECGDRLTDAGADQPKLGLSPPNRTLPLSATLAGVARISMVIFSSCFCIVVSIPVVALRANRTDEVAAFVQLSGIPFRAIAPKIGHPFTYIAALAVLSDKFNHVVSSPCAHIAWTHPQLRTPDRPVTRPVEASCLAGMDRARRRTGVSVEYWPQQHRSPLRQ